MGSKWHLIDWLAGYFMVGTRHAIVRFGPASNFRLPPSCGTARGFFPCFQNVGRSNPRRAATLSPQVFFPSMRERLVAAEGLEPQACKSRPGGGPSSRVSPCFALLCSVMLCHGMLSWSNMILKFSYCIIMYIINVI